MPSVRIVQVGASKDCLQKQAKQAALGSIKHNSVVSHMQDRQDYPILQVGDKANVHKPLQVTVQVDGHHIEMKVDTRASLSLILQETYQRLWPSFPLQKLTIKLRTYSGQRVRVLGSLEVDTLYRGQTDILPILVAEWNGLSLLGRTG